MPMDAKALWSMSYGMYLVSARAGDRANGQIANAVFQVAAEPPRVAAAINRENFTHDLIRDGGWFAFAVLAEDVPMEMIGLFGFKSGRDVDKLAQVKVREGLHAPWVVDHALAVSEARVLNTVDAGTHTVFVAEVVAAEVLQPGLPLTYAGYHARKGRAPKTAPTYRAEPAAEPVPVLRAVGATWTCGVCGYTYDPAEGDPAHGVAPGTPFDDLPADWVCPACGAPKAAFLAD